MSEPPRAAVVALGVTAAVVLNLAVYAIGRAAGATYRFTSRGEPVEVDALTVAGFSAVPLLIGLTAVALLVPRAGWVATAALIVGPLLAVVTVPLMTVPADFDTASTAALAICHLMLVPVIVVAVLRMRPPRPAPA
jgi:phosphatidylserine synthase